VPRRARQNKTPRKQIQRSITHRNIFGDPIAQQQFTGTRFASENHVYDFVQFIDQANLNTVGPLVCNVAGVTGSYAVSLAQVGQVASFQALFDQYRIFSIEMAFIPRVNVIDNSTAPTVGPNSGSVYSYVDLDDAAATTVASAQQRSNAIVVPGYKPFSHTWRPHQATSGQSIVLATVGAINLESQWNDLSSPTIGHFGCKVVWTSAQTAFYAYDIFTRIHLQFRNVQ
jgi:hypothetical protein